MIKFRRYKDLVIELRTKATSDFWDSEWESHNNWIENVTLKGHKDMSLIKRISKYIPLNGSVLEAGCGMGQFVFGLHRAGYRAYGLDFARATVQKLNSAVPELDIRYGDVERLPFDNNFFDAYYSGGLIEHFWSGYNPTLEEAHRVLKKDGLLVLSCPVMSKSKRKLMLRCAEYVSETEPENFYQFYLDREELLESLTPSFEILEVHLENPLRDLVDTNPDRTILSKVYYSKTVLNRLLRKTVNRIFSNNEYYHHSVLILARKR